MSNQALVTPLVLIATIALVSALKIAEAVFAPVACALLIIALVWPFQKMLQRYVPHLLALAVVLAIVVCVFMTLASITAWGFGRIGRSVVADSARFQVLYEQLAEWLEGHGIIVAGVWAEHFNVGWMLRMLQGATARLNTTISFWIVVIVYVLLGLLDVESVARNIRKALSQETANAVIAGVSQTASKLRRYMLVRTIMSIATGALVWVLAEASGLHFAAEWGVIALTLNYIPFIGPFVATLLPSAYALAQFGSPFAAVLIFAGLNVIQFIVGSYLEPRVAGYALSLSPFLVLFSVFLWSYLWGVFGAFIGVPITITALTFFWQFSSTRWVAEICGGPTRPPH